MADQIFDDPLIGIERTLFTGMNSKDYAGVIGTSQVSLAENIDFSRPGLVQGTNGYMQTADTVGSRKVLALRRFIKAGGSDFLMMVEDTNLRSWGGSGNWSAPLKNNLSSDMDTLLVVGNGVVLVSNGTDNVQSYNQINVSDLGDTNTSPPKARVGAYISNRFFLANTTLYPDYFWWSDVLSTTFDRSTNVIKLNSGTGTEINGIVDLGNGEVALFKEDEVHMLYITDPSPLNWRALKIADEDGAISKKAIVRVGNDVFYLSRRKKGITSIGKNSYDKTSGRVVALSDPILKEWMENINWPYAYKSCAAVFDNKIIFAVPMRGATVPDHWIILHLHEDQSLNGWAVRKSPPTYCFEKYLIGGNEYLFFGHNDAGRMLKAFTGFTDEGAAVEKTFEGRIEDFSESGARYNNKIGSYVELSFLLGEENGAVDVWFETDENGFNLLGTVDTSTSAAALPGGLPFALPDEAKMTERFDLSQVDQWRKCRLMLRQTQADKNFQFMGYLIVARRQPIV